MCEAADSDLGLTPSRSERSAQGSQIQQNALALGRQREKHQCVGRGELLGRTERAARAAELQLCAQAR